MSRFRKLALATSFTVMAVGAPMAQAQESAGKETLTEEDVAMIIVGAQQQLIRLSEQATEEYQDTLRADSPSMPAAWMMMKDGETVKRLNISGQADNMPAAAKIKMYRAAIKSIAQRGQINAAAILYTGRVNEQSSEQVMVIEHEHRLGVSSNKVIGYRLQDGKVSWAEPVTQEKPFEWFYDGSKEDS
ncbi:hypothetical protein [Marinobacter halophilus]|uniref:DUF1318 domain-containing protein n=1 Tax=Marinobacter halophilus TaxID=1323740 RepID=A0A2T1K8F4_9GAMM|nr:hypothetical protein [Marinobacter halophilus]PSF06416.1 hypothetical protein C7H08_14985 [Marinobacter halophilus]GGC72399.1 hypothetical protein GCM10011362_21140 [Marinobacter halophilus]